MNATDVSPVIFSLKGVVGLRVAHPDMTPARSTLANNVRAEFVRGPFGIELTAQLNANQQVTLRIEDAALARAITSALGSGAAALEYCLKRAQQTLPAAAARVPARSCKTAVPPTTGAGAAAGSTSPARKERPERAYWREIFEHWVKTGLTLAEFCKEVTWDRAKKEVCYDFKKTYAAFYRLFYREFMQHLDKLAKKGGAK